MVPVTFEELKSRGEQAVDAGQLEEARGPLRSGPHLGPRARRAPQVDLGICNRAAVAIELGRGDGELPRLREILVRNGDPVNCQLAAYNISRYYELTKNYKKCAVLRPHRPRRAGVLGRRDWLASSHNLIGNTLLAESFIDEACREYEKALELMRRRSRPSGAARSSTTSATAASCRGATTRATACSTRACASLKRCGAAAVRDLRPPRPLLRPSRDRAAFASPSGTARAALALAETMERSGRRSRTPSTCSARSPNLSGDVEAARGYFGRLQRDFFPDAGYLPEFLLAVDVRKLVNLHA